MKQIAFLLYRYIAIHLPGSNVKFSLGSKFIRSTLARKFIKKAGSNINIERGAIFSKNLEIGDNSNLGINSLVSGKVIIGDNVLMGPEVYIYTRNHNFSDLNIPIKDQGYEEEKKVIIKNNVWIGSRVTILPGVTIGEGSIIGASAVVTKDIEAFSIVGGNPAKILKYRNK